MHDFSLLSQSLAVVIGAIAGLIGAILNFKKNKHKEDQDTVKDYKELYLDMKAQRDVLKKELEELKHGNSK